MTATIGHAPDDFIENKGISKNEIAIFYASLGLLVAINLLGFVAFLRPALAGRSDFRIFYTAGYIVRSGNSASLYDVETQRTVQNSQVSAASSPLLFNHAPYEALLFVPFTYFGYRAAYLMFLGLNCIVLAAIYRKLREIFENAFAAWRWVPVALMGSFLPLFIALMQGQDSILLLGLFMLCQMMLLRENDAAAGFFLAIGLFKFQFVMPLAFLLALRRWRFLTGFAATSAALAGVSLWMVGVAGARSMTRMLINMSVHLTTQPQQAHFMVFPSSMGNLRGLVETLVGGQIGDSSQQLLIAALSLGLFFWSALRAKGFASAVIFAVLVSYHALPHDLSLLTLPISVACARLAKGISDRGRLELAIVGLLVCAPTVLLFFGSSFYLYAIVLLGALILRPEMFDSIPRRGPTAGMANAS